MIDAGELAYTENDDEKEVDVGNVMKLKPQVFWNETQWCVFRGSYLVSGVMLLDTSLFVFCFVRERDVHVDHPRFRLNRRARIFGGRLLGIGAKFRLVRLVCWRSGSLPIEDRETLPVTALTWGSLSGPPYPLDRLRHIVHALELDLRHIELLPQS